MHDNREKSRIFGFQRQEITRRRRKLRDEFYYVYSSPNIRVITSRRMKLTRHVPRIGEMRGKYHLEDTDADRIIILKWTLNI
jgi:hypothetical protein